MPTKPEKDAVGPRFLQREWKTWARLGEFLLYAFIALLGASQYALSSSSGMAVEFPTVMFKG